jgi:OOP family OmpA-OmpF porin
MCNWTKWFWPGLVTAALLTALTGWFFSGPVEQDLALRANDQLRAGQPWATVAFDGRDGIVSGIAENDVQQREAANIAASTYGVRVIGNKTVLPEPAKPFALFLSKAGEGISLKGNYADTKSRLALVEAVEKAMPGIPVKDELVLASGKPQGFDALAAFGVSQLADLASGEVSLADLAYSIKGMPAGLEVYDKLTAATATLPAGGTLKLAEIALPELGKPYEISAAYDGNTVTLDGYAPSADAKAAIEGKAASLFSGKTVNSLLKLAAGAPDGFAGWVEFGLEQVSKLKDGAFSVTGSDFALKGSVADASGYDAAVKALTENLPAGLKLAANELVKPAEPEPVAAPEPVPAAQPEPAPAPEPVISETAKACQEAIGDILSTGEINFESSKAIITAASFPVIEKIARTLKACPDVAMEIGGHTDSDGDDASNQALSDARANAVLRWLLGFGADPAKVSARGYGETQPVAPNDTNENKAKNRRIEFRVVQ